MYGNGERILTKHYEYAEDGTRMVKEELGITDIQGNVIAAYDAISGEMTGRMEYDPRRNVIWGMTKAADEGKRRYDIYGYTGKEREQEIGLAYFGARWYNADMGRFISCDPISTNLSSPQNLNKYHYCLNSPVNYTDPLGLTEDDYTIYVTDTAYIIKE